MASRCARRPCNQRGRINALRATLTCPALRALQVRLELGDLLKEQLLILEPKKVGRRLNALHSCPQILVRHWAAQGFNATQARTDAAIRGDDEAPYLACCAAVGTSAELMGVVRHPDCTNALAILLVKEGVRTSVHRLLHAHLRRHNRNVGPNRALHFGLNRVALVARQGTVERVVKPKVFGVDE